MEYQVVTVSAVMQGLEKESVFVTRVRKNHTEPTVRDNRLQSIFYKAESSFEKKKKMCIWTWKISCKARKAIEIGSLQIKIPGEHLVLSIACWKTRKADFIWYY